MAVLVTYKNEEDSIKIKGLGWLQTYMSIFQMLKSRLFRSQWWDQVEVQSHPSIFACPCYLQE